VLHIRTHGRGFNPSRSDPRSGCLLQRHIRPTCSLTRHSGPSDVGTLAVAERVCGAPDRLDPPGMPRPYCCDRRAAPAPRPQMLHGVLQRGAHASIVGQGCAHWEGHPVRRTHRSAACAWWIAPSVRADLICGSDRRGHFVRTVFTVRGEEQRTPDRINSLLSSIGPPHGYDLLTPAPSTGSAGHAGATASAKLTSNPDHSMWAAHGVPCCAAQGFERGRYRIPRCRRR